MSNLVGGHLMALVSADNRSENGSRVVLLEDDRRNRQRIDERHRRLRPCSERWSAPPNQRDW